MNRTAAPKVSTEAPLREGAPVPRVATPKAEPGALLREGIPVNHPVVPSADFAAPLRSGAPSTVVDLARVGAGFSDPALGSQAVFRAALRALSHPGRVIELPHDAEVPAQGHAASAALLLALLDPDCSLWLSPSLAAGDAAGWLRFHSGCRLVSEPGAAQFAWIAVGDALPPLERFAQGSDAAPDQSTTCVLDVPRLGEGSGGSAGEACWMLGGPGIDGSRALRIGGLPDAALAALRAQRAANHAAFPRGTDMFLATPTHVVGLPRTTRIEAGD